MDDLQIPQFRSLQEAAEGLYLLGVPESPIRDVMRSIARQLSTGTSPDPAPPQGQGQSQAQQRVQAATGVEPSAAEPVNTPAPDTLTGRTMQVKPRQSPAHRLRRVVTAAAMAQAAPAP